MVSIFLQDHHFLESLNLNLIQKQIYTFTLEVKQTTGKNIGGQREILSTSNSASINFS